MRERMRLAGVICAVALAALVAVSGFEATRARADGAVISIDPPSQNVGADAATLAVNVKATNANNVGGWEFAVKFNPDVLEVVDVVDDGYLAPLGLQISCQRGQPPRWDADVVDFSCGAIGGAFTGQGGSGDLATITFRPKKTGSSDLVFMKST